MTMPRVARLALLPLLLACTGDEPAGRAPPPAEFLLAAGDSTFWVRSSRDGLLARGVPMLVARVNGRFYEMYVADDDRSYPRAVFVGQRLYRRDLLSGDSLVIFADTSIPALARAYARANPDQRPLRPNEELEAEPLTEAIADIEVLDVHGAFVSVEYHLDQADEAGETRYVARAVVDARDGRRATLRELFGDSAARAIVAAGERAFTAAIDSVLSARDERALTAATALADFSFDARSFALAQSGIEVAVAFLAPGTGERAGGLALPLAPVRAGAPGWWKAIRDQLPSTTSAIADEWSRTGYRVRAQYQPSDDAIELQLVTDSATWRTGPLPAPARRIYWLDTPGTDSLTRAALRRAFDEAALYSDEARRVDRPRRAPPVISVSGAARHSLPLRSG